MYRITEYLLGYEAYDPTKEFVGFIHPADPTRAMWYCRKIGANFWYFDGTTSVEFLHKEATNSLYSWRKT